MKYSTWFVQKNSGHKSSPCRDPVCVPGDQLDTASSVKLNTSRSWCLYSPLCHQKCWSFCANHLVHIIWQNSRLLVCVYNGYGGGPQNGWIVGAVQSTVIRLKSGMLVKTRIQAGFSITFAVTFRHIGVVWEDVSSSQTNSFYAWMIQTEIILEEIGYWQLHETRMQAPFPVKFQEIWTLL